jgi:hypothetical protein
MALMMIIATVRLVVNVDQEYAQAINACLTVQRLEE